MQIDELHPRRRAANQGLPTLHFPFFTLHFASISVIEKPDRPPMKIPRFLAAALFAALAFIPVIPARDRGPEAEHPLHPDR